MAQLFCRSLQLVYWWTEWQVLCGYHTIWRYLCYLEWVLLILYYQRSSIVDNLWYYTVIAICSIFMAMMDHQFLIVILGVIYPWLLVVAIYSQTLLCRKVGSKRLDVDPGFISPVFCIFYSISFLGMVVHSLWIRTPLWPRIMKILFLISASAAWIYVFLSEEIWGSFIALFISTAAAYVALYSSCWRLAQCESQMVVKNLIADIWCTHAIIQNGLSPSLCIIDLSLVTFHLFPVNHIPQVWLCMQPGSAVLQFSTPSWSLCMSTVFPWRCAASWAWLFWMRWHSAGLWWRTLSGLCLPCMAVMDTPSTALPLS